jgi:chromate transporter
MNPLITFWLLLKASLFSFSGFGNLPSVHADLTSRGWATERQFAESLAVGQLAPGPNGLWVVSLGYLMDGLRGALIATVAIILPPMLVLILDRVYQRVEDHPAIEGFIRGLSLAVIGIFAMVLYRILETSGLEIRSALIAIGAFALGTFRKVPVVLILAAAGLLGFLLW